PRYAALTWQRSLTAPRLSRRPHRADPARRPAAAGAAYRVRQLVSLDEPYVLDALDDQLGDAIARREPYRLAGIVVDHDHLDLPAVAGVDGAGRIDQPDAHARREAPTRVDKGRVAERAGHRDAGR